MAKTVVPENGSRTTAEEDPPPSRFRAFQAPSERMSAASSPRVSPRAADWRPSATTSSRVLPSWVSPAALRGAANIDWMPVCLHRSDGAAPSCSSTGLPENAAVMSPPSGRNCPEISTVSPAESDAAEVAALPLTARYTRSAGSGDGSGVEASVGRGHPVIRDSTVPPRMARHVTPFEGGRRCHDQWLVYNTAPLAGTDTSFTAEIGMVSPPGPSSCPDQVQLPRIPMSLMMAIEAKSRSSRGERTIWPSATSRESGAPVTPASKKSPLIAATRPAASAIWVASAGEVSVPLARAGPTAT